MKIKSYSTSMPNRDIVVWDSKFEIKIPFIDAQHKKLIELCNNLHKAIIAMPDSSGVVVDDWQDSLLNALRECVDYTQTHFRDEENLMQAAGFVDFTQHKSFHSAFVKKILETAKSFEKKIKLAHYDLFIFCMTGF